MSVSVEAIAKAGANWSIEVTPTGATKIDSFAALLAENTSVNVTFLPGTDSNDTIAVAKRLSDEGMNAIPHIAARSLSDKDQLDGLLKRMTSEANVSEVLVIGGGVDTATAVAVPSFLHESPWANLHRIRCRGPAERAYRT